MIRRQEHFNLAGRNTFRMDVGCACWVEYDSLEDLAGLDLAALPQPVLHVGAGSNLLFTGDFPGTLLHSAVKYYKTVADAEEEVLVEVGAGVVFDDFCAWASDNELWGAENLSGIPGEVGAAAVQNIGAYGAEVKDIIAQVKCFDLQERGIVTFAPAQCGYGYRDSAFKHAPLKGRQVVLGVLFRLSKAPRPRLDYGPLKTAFADRAPAHPSEIRQLILGIRDAKLPDPTVLGSAGSFFKNPVVSQETYEHVVAIASGPVSRCGSESRTEPCRGMLSEPQRQPGLEGTAESGAGIEEPDGDPSGKAPLKPSPAPQLSTPAAAFDGAGAPCGCESIPRQGSVQLSQPQGAPVPEAQRPPVPHYEVGPDQIKIPAAWLIDQCGLKGLQLGEAAVYDKQPLVIVNATGTARPEDILALEQTVIDRVRQKFGIELHPEVEHISAALAAQQPKI